MACRDAVSAHICMKTVLWFLPHPSGRIDQKIVHLYLKGHVSQLYAHLVWDRHEPVDHMTKFMTKLKRKKIYFAYWIKQFYIGEFASTLILVSITKHQQNKNIT